ncbi:MAG: hypothetical protein B7X90_15505 [Novosphingobium sp. 17-62-19]|uniref:DUF2322 family protein n=1 Tax=Novosphingobium sp. 17-62-19 TaxID=1970406 RepID=UPI000BD5B040|nr:DUF2322 family protein [Novosphingobium sp. 17-62-19]OYX96715.1 MAG: hypothetical protein B7Y74_00435 [Novosphingobium sp. 35-62-5]OZA17310.1 MAG: hypothetical protein B7X90_15505 [Novosphingobium sp. 17-62-19]HQS96651.1 DUF2322 family protein [Novosphingobium sp.]
MQSRIQAGASFKDNLAQLPSIEGIARIDLIDASGEVVASIPNEPGKQGSLSVYQYLGQNFGALTPEAAEHGLAVFGEHTADAKVRPGAHPNIDLLFEVQANKVSLTVKVVAFQQ